MEKQMKQTIKEVIADILYLNSTEEIADNAAIFTELGLSSIDYIDLCFELDQKYDIEITQDDMWPINRMLLQENYFDNDEWTDAGWRKVCQVVGLDESTKKMPIQDLQHAFTVNYIERRIKELCR